MGAQPTCAISERFEATHKQVTEIIGDKTPTRLGGPGAERYLTALALITGNPSPDMDTLYFYIQESMVFVVGFKDGCVVGAARVPFDLHMNLYSKLNVNRAIN